jgi:hypothetical protein
MTVKNRPPSRLVDSLPMIKTLRQIHHPKDAAKTSAFHSSPRPPLANQTALSSSETRGLHGVKPSVLWPKISFILVLALFAASESETTGHVPSRQSPGATPCSALEYRQFDFWLGDWDAFDAGQPALVARTRVDRTLDGCVLRENYQGSNGLKGQSFSIRFVPKGVASELGNQPRSAAGH